MVWVIKIIIYRNSFDRHNPLIHLCAKPTFFFFFFWLGVYGFAQKNENIFFSIPAIPFDNRHCLPFFANRLHSALFFINLQQLNPGSNIGTDTFSNDPDLVEQTQPFISGTPSLQDITGPPITDSSLDEARFQPASPSNSDTAGSSFELAEKLPPRKPGPKVPAAVSATLETIYLCCEPKGEDTYRCDER